MAERFSLPKEYLNSEFKSFNQFKSFVISISLKIPFDLTFQQQIRL